MRNRSRTRSRPRAEIEPIHIPELLNGAGMTGFLSVLNPPVRAPHLQELGAQREVRGGGEAAGDALAGARERVVALLALVGRQEEGLKAIVEIANRINCGAARLQRCAEAARRGRPSRDCLQERRAT